MNLDIALDFFESTLGEAKAFAASVPDGRLAEQPAGVRNHPAWTLTHLCVGIDAALSLLGKEALSPQAYHDLAGYGSTPVADRGAYPSRDELVQRLHDSHAAFAEVVRGLPADTFAKPTPEPYRAFFPTLGHVVAYFLMAHEPTHLGQLTAWRRAAGLSA